VKSFETALSDRNGRATLYLSDDGNAGRHSLFDESAGRSKIIDIETITLDSVFEKERGKINLVKLDAEGSEMFILLGMEKLLESGSPRRIIMEFCPSLMTIAGVNPKDLLKMVESFGFTTRLITKTGLEDTHLSSLCALPEKVSVNLLLERNPSQD
jgi:hypothetical protein